MSKQYAVRETKTTDVDIEDGDPIVRETWLLEYEDGHADVLQRRHPVTDPHERDAIMNEMVPTLTINVQAPGVVHPVAVTGIIV